jgi:hypothetical protein
MSGGSPRGHRGSTKSIAMLYAGENRGMLTRIFERAQSNVWTTEHRLLIT